MDERVKKKRGKKIEEREEKEGKRERVRGKKEV